MSFSPPQNPRSDQTKAPPVRTCVGCRSDQPQSGLVRFIVGEDSPYLAPDLRGSFPGRGYWVGPRRGCLKAAIERRAFKDGLPERASVSVEHVAQATVKAYEKRLTGLTQGGWRNGLVHLGVSETLDALNFDGTELIWLAPGGGSTRDSVRRKAEARGVPVLEYGDSQMMGAIFGRDSVSTLAYMDSGIAEEARRCVTRAAAFSEVA